jgi:agmatinase
MLYLNKNLVLESTAPLKEAKIALLGVPFDSTSSYRAGSRTAPLEIRKEFFELEKEDDFFEIPFHELGNIDAVPGNALETLRRMEHTLAYIYKENPDVFLLTLGGEHTITFPIVKRLAENSGEKITVVNLDAHMDLKDDYLGEKWCHASVMRRISELDVNMVEIGVRSFNDAEKKYAEKKGIQYFGIKKTSIRKILDSLAGKKVYFSLDFDAVTPEVASGVSNPEPNGLMLDDLYFIFNRLIQKSIVIGLDIVEVNPLYDKTATTVAAATFMRDAITAAARKR